jgi:ornithine racemase
VIAMYPRIDINIKKLKYNVNQVQKLCRSKGIGFWAVTKGFCALPEVARALVEAGADGLADSRLDNLKKLKDIPCKKILLRLPMQCELDSVVEYADYSFNSDLSSLTLLGQAALKRGKTHNVIIMIDMGDLREGLWPSEVDSFVGRALDIRGIEIKGFGVNLTCFGGVLPEEDNLGKFARISHEMEVKYNLDIEIISGGNSSSFYLLNEGRLPVGINNLRFGEVILFGSEAAFGQLIDGLHNDSFILKAQIVEIRKKPSIPIGNIGKDAFGNVPVFEDKGVVKRAIVAMGKQDIDLQTIHPIDESIEIIGASSDHTILNLSNCSKDYKVGDVVEFYIHYVSLLKASTSNYVNKNVINE